MTTTKTTVTLNVFKDKDGDYLVTTAPAIVAGIPAYQLDGKAVDAEGGPVAALQDCPFIVLIMQSGKLRDGDSGTVADLTAQLEHELVESAELDADDNVIMALNQA